MGVKRLLLAFSALLATADALKVPIPGLKTAVKWLGYKTRAQKQRELGEAEARAEAVLDAENEPDAETAGDCFNAKKWREDFMNAAVKKGRDAELGDGYRRYSQGYQDGFIEKLFQTRGMEDTNRMFVEMGFGKGDEFEKASSPEMKHFREISYEKHGNQPTGGSNTENLLDAKDYHDRWKGIRIAGNPTMKKKRAALSKLFEGKGPLGASPQVLLADGHDVLTETILPHEAVDLLGAAHVPKDLDYLSIHENGCDLWMMSNITESAFRPRLISVRYNARYSLDESVASRCLDFESQEMHLGDGHGATSLKAVYQMARARGYHMIWVEPHLDAFLVREDLVCDGTELELENFRSVTGLPQKERMTEDSEKHWMVQFEAPPRPEYCDGMPGPCAEQQADGGDIPSSVEKNADASSIDEILLGVSAGDFAGDADNV